MSNFERKPVLRGIVLFLGFILAGIAAQADVPSPAVDFSGTWIAKIETGMGLDEVTLTLKKAGTSYTGIVNDSLGIIDKDTPLTGIALEDGAIVFSFKAMGGTIDFGMKLKRTAETLSGEVQNKAEDGGAPITFELKK